MTENNFNDQTPNGLWVIGALNLLGLTWVIYDSLSEGSVFLLGLIALCLLLIYGLVILKANWARIIFLFLAWIGLIQFIISILLLFTKSPLSSSIYYLTITTVILVISLMIQIWIIKYLTRPDIAKLFGVIPKGQRFNDEAACPFCRKPLRTKLAKQCPHCFEDWHHKPQIKALIENDTN